MLAIAWMTNLFNFMDGADGLAGCQGVAGFAAYAAGFALAGDHNLAAWCAAVAAACGGFLLFNWPPARIFMGDVGSIPLGFLAGAMGFWGVWHGVWPVWFPLVAFAPFVLDASTTLLRRALSGARVWEAHRDHYYQRMVRLGYGHRGMTMRWGAVMLVGAAVGVAMLLVPARLQWALAFVWVASLATVGHGIDRLWRSRAHAP
jgi:UDP-N-acetylmuramyl pentapeptide phosphotransferase/UDP-N-acetylglucosamine-1-phosphate transferase